MICLELFNCLNRSLETSFQISMKPLTLCVFFLLEVLLKPGSENKMLKLKTVLIIHTFMTQPLVICGGAGEHPNNVRKDLHDNTAQS